MKAAPGTGTGSPGPGTAAVPYSPPYEVPGPRSAPGRRETPVRGTDLPLPAPSPAAGSGAKRPGARSGGPATSYGSAAAPYGSAPAEGTPGATATRTAPAATASPSGDAALAALASSAGFARAGAGTSGAPAAAPSSPSSYADEGEHGPAPYDRRAGQAASWEGRTPAAHPGAAPADTARRGDTEPTHARQQHPSAPAYAEESVDEPAGRKGGRRGIGAWARRLAAGRAAADRSATGPAGAGPAAPPGAGQETWEEAPGAREEWPHGGGPGAFAAGSARPGPAAPPGGPEAYERWPDAATVLLTALGPGPRLWERAADHPDALTVRLGTAPQHGGRAVVPVTVALRTAGSLGLAGPRARLAGLARSALAQLAALHSPTGLEIVLLATDRGRSLEERLADWSWLGWLPHTRPTHGQDCRLLLAYDKEQATARTTELVRRLDDSPLGLNWAAADRQSVAAAAAQHTGPYTVVVVDGDPGSSGLRETTARLASAGAAAGIHLICLTETPASSPSFPLAATYEAARAASPAFGECGAVAVLSGDVATALRVVQPGTGPNGTVATVDAVSGAWAERFARALAPLREADPGTGGRSARRAAVPLPDSSRLLDELGLARATPASLMARWAAAGDSDRPGATAVLGAGPHGPLCADLASEGPHLVVAGGPGSGKTELLRSLAASLAAADRPDLLSLVLVDGGGAERGEGLRMCTDLPHVTTYLAASDPVRMREFAQALTSELKRRAETLEGTEFAEWRARQHLPAQRTAPSRRTPEGSSPNTGAGPGGGSGAATSDAAGPGTPATAPGGAEAESSPSTLRLRARGIPGAAGGVTGPAGGACGAAGGAAQGTAPMPRLFVLVDDFDALVAPALGSTGRPAAGSVVRALEAVARDGERLGVHLIASTGHPGRTAETAACERAGLRVELGSPSDTAEPVPPGRGRLLRAEEDSATPFQAGRVTGRIPRTSTLRPTVVPLEWQRMGDPPARRPLRELGNGPTDLALLASALQRAAQSSGAEPAPPLL
ncbi:FtsK/SpoIIIE domain-containing protein [Streptomyces sp. MST-110588]|uniref:FtsK/SpoIIIE domain-containing protein n=1 Tax=Streptomyces sp. MST-110588 TaxID=2833628 RepID=UPI001F5DFDD7|nr:FtsK/SpoIIIE domain-containing protein [Streptomyces sp. MST-110588]